MKYQVSLFKTSGKYYINLEEIISKENSLYTTVADIIENKYKDYLKDGYLILVEDENEVKHIFKM